MSIVDKWATIYGVLTAIEYAVLQYRYKEIDRITLLSRVEECLREVLPYSLAREIVSKLDEDVDNKSTGEILAEIQEILKRSLIGDTA